MFYFPKKHNVEKMFVLFLFFTIIAAYCSMEDRVNIASLLNIYERIYSNN